MGAHYKPSHDRGRDRTLALLLLEHMTWSSAAPACRQLRYLPKRSQLMLRMAITSLFRVVHGCKRPYELNTDSAGSRQQSGADGVTNKKGQPRDVDRRTGQGFMYCIVFDLDQHCVVFVVRALMQEFSSTADAKRAPCKCEGRRSRLHNRFH